MEQRSLDCGRPRLLARSSSVAAASEPKSPAQAFSSTFRPVCYGIRRPGLRRRLLRSGEPAKSCRHCGEGCSRCRPYHVPTDLSYPPPSPMASCSIRTTPAKVPMLLLAAHALILYESILRPGTPARNTPPPAPVCDRRGWCRCIALRGLAPAKRRTPQRAAGFIPAGSAVTSEQRSICRRPVKYVSNQLR